MKLKLEPTTYRPSALLAVLRREATGVTIKGCEAATTSKTMDFVPFVGPRAPGEQARPRREVEARA